MKISKKNTALRQELHLQRKTIFGNNRYWFHILIWAMVAIISFTQTQDLTSGFNMAISKGHKSNTLSDSALIIEFNSEDDKILTNNKQDKESLTAKKGIPINNEIIYYNIAIGSLVGGIMVYFYLLLVIPYARYKKRKRILIIGLFVNLFIFMLTLFLTGFLVAFLEKGNPGPQNVIIKTVVIYVILTALFSIIVTTYFFSIYYFIDLYDQQKYLNRYQQVFTDKLQAETIFLKTQINPHFLFNTLNNIYSLSLSQSDDAVTITRQLKDLIQYMLNDCARDTVPISGEINFLKNYIALEQLRNKQENTDIQLNLSGSAQGMEIAPLLLINFVENAFKHGVKSGIERSFVKIDLSLTEKMLSLTIINSIPEYKSNPSLAVKQDGGIGIKNVKRRLEILYPQKHKLKISQTEKEYIVQLNITL